MPEVGRRGVPPVVADLRAAQQAERASFHMPGHKGGPGVPDLGAEVLGRAAYQADLSELSGLDYLHGASGGVADAQRGAAMLFGADRSWFLINGATVGNIAALWAAAGDGQSVLMARSSHRSVYAALCVAGVRPRYLAPRHNPALDGLFGIDLEQLAVALETDPTIAAVHITSPNYYGFTVPVAEVVSLAHARGLPVIVDEAHGSHFVFDADFPSPALTAGADLVVQSPHKTLGSLTQSSLLHHRDGLVDPLRVDALLQMLQSSSPSALLLVSLDVALDEMRRRGRARWGAALALARGVRTDLSRLGGLSVYGPEVVGTPGISDFDPTKVVVDVSGLDVTAFAAAGWLRRHHRINPEFADLRRMVFSITTADDPASVQLLVSALADLVGRHGELSGPARSVASLWPSESPEMVFLPRQAAEMRAHALDLDRSAGRISGEMIVPYPPGVPLVVPGERISEAVVNTIRQLRQAGCRVVGGSDQSLDTIRCLDG